MKKYGKYEKRTEGKQPKSALLQTYFTSLVCLMLCVTMFFGTSYAWFTREVNNTGNEIYIGTLDVELDKKTASGWDSLSAIDTDGNNTAKLYSNTFWWEPGYTSVETVRVTNKGTLALRYELNFTDGLLDGTASAELQAVAQWFDIWVYHDADNTIPTVQNFEQVTDKANGWTKVGTLADALNGKPIFTGMITKEDIAKDSSTAHTYTIALHMNKSAEADTMGKKISLNVKLVAYQQASEQDSFGNGSYDDVIYVSNLEELKTALAEGKNTVLLNDVGVESGKIQVNGGILDGNGNMVTCIKSMNAKHSVILTTGGTIKNLTIDRIGGTVQGIGAGMSTENPLTEDLYIENVTVYASYYSIVGTSNGANVYVNKSTLYGGISYIGASLIKASDTHFAIKLYEAPEMNAIELSGEASFTNCSFDDGYCINAETAAKGKTITFENCTVNDVKLTAENFEEKLIADKYDNAGTASSVNMKECKVIVNGVEVQW